MSKTKQPPLKILVCSGNVGNAAPTLESIAAWIPPFGACDQVNPMIGKEKKLASGFFDMVVIGMQESTWKKTYKSESKDEDVASPSKDRPKIKRAGSSILLEGIEAHDSVSLKDMIQETLGDDYTLLSYQQRGQMRLQIWARKELADDIPEDSIVINGENTGIAGVMANKGGIVMTLTYKKTRITFFSAHLAAHEGQPYYTARCDNIREILRGAKTFDKYDTAISSHHMFIIGDLNFRTKFGEYGSTEHEESFKRAMDFIDRKDYEGLYSFDELTAGIENGDILVNFKTLPCHFPPTFKVQREEGFVYKDQRVPSYTDRILFKSADGLSRHLKPLAYEPCVDFITSDHKPIRGAFTIDLNEIIDKAEKSDETDFEGLRLTFSDIQCNNLPVMDIDGSSDPYVKFIWDGVDVLRAGDKKKSKGSFKSSQPKWPVTKMKPKELNPTWEDEIVLTVNGPVTSDAILFLTVMDYDATSSDDLMCTLPITLKKLITEAMQNDSKKIFIDKPLLKYGKREGRIRFTVTVSDELPSSDGDEPDLKKKSSFFKRTKKYFGS